MGCALLRSGQVNLLLLGHLLRCRVIIVIIIVICNYVCCASRHLLVLIRLVAATRATLPKVITRLGIEPRGQTAEVEGMRARELHLARCRGNGVVADSAVHFVV